MTSKKEIKNNGENNSLKIIPNNSSFLIGRRFDYLGTAEDSVSEVQFLIPQNLSHTVQCISLKADKTFWRAWGQIGTACPESQKLLKFP